MQAKACSGSISSFFTPARPTTSSSSTAPASPATTSSPRAPPPNSSNTQPLSPGCRVWKEAFPIGGEYGTLESRFANPPLKDHLFAKTGTLGEARALSGYLDAASGRTVIFSIMVGNHLPGDSSDRDAMDKIVAAIQQAEQPRHRRIAVRPAELHLHESHRAFNLELPPTYRDLSPRVRLSDLQEVPHGNRRPAPAGSASRSPQAQSRPHLLPHHGRPALGRRPLRVRQNLFPRRNGRGPASQQAHPYPRRHHDAVDGAALRPDRPDLRAQSEVAHDPGPLRLLRRARHGHPWPHRGHGLAPSRCRRPWTNPQDVLRHPPQRHLHLRGADLPRLSLPPPTRRPQAAFILIATIGIIDAAVGRWPIAFFENYPKAQDLVPFGFLLAVMVFDLATQRKILVTLYASLFLVVHLTRVHALRSRTCGRSLPPTCSAKDRRSRLHIPSATICP